MGSIPDRHTADLCMTVGATILTRNRIGRDRKSRIMGVNAMSREVIANIGMAVYTFTILAYGMVQGATESDKGAIGAGRSRIGMADLTIAIVNDGDDCRRFMASGTLGGAGTDQLTMGLGLMARSKIIVVVRMTHDTGAGAADQMTGGITNGSCSQGTVRGKTI